MLTLKHDLTPKELNQVAELKEYIKQATTEEEIVESQQKLNHIFSKAKSRQQYKNIHTISLEQVFDHIHKNEYERLMTDIHLSATTNDVKEKLNRLFNLLIEAEAMYIDNILD